MSDVRSHAKRYAPSASHRWTVCHASARFNEQYASESSSYALDGTEAHDLLAFALNNKIRNAIEAKVAYPGKWVHRDDSEPVRLDSVQAALDYVYRVLDAFPEAVVFIEQRVDFVSPHTDDCWGHSDVIIWIPSLRIIEAVDFKHGAGELVEVKGNTQLGIYGAATYQHVKAKLNVQPSCIVMTIIQPRAWHEVGVVRHWIMSDSEMDNVFIPKINGDIAKCEDPNAPFVPGEKQCKWCPGAFNCRAREAAALQALPVPIPSFQNVTRDALPPVNTLPIDKLVWITQSARFLKDYIREAQEALYNAALAGAHIPGKKLVEPWGERAWYGNHLDVARELMKLMDTEDWDMVYPRVLIGITEAEQKVKKAFKDRAPRGKKKEAAAVATDALALLTLKQSSGRPQLVDEDDSRPSIAARGAHQFQGVTLIMPPKGK